MEHCFRTGFKGKQFLVFPKTVRVQPVAATPSDSPGIPALRPDQNSWTLADISVLISLEGQPSF
jgi:hypothetical protein